MRSAWSVVVDRSLLTPDPLSTPGGDDGPWFATQLLARLARESLDSGGAPVRSAFLTAAEAETVAELLDELAGVSPGEELGQLAGTLSAPMWERLPR